MRWPVLLTLLFWSSTLPADTLTFTNEDGEKETLEARWVGANQGVAVVELADGQIRLIDQRSISRREPNELPEPLSPQELAGQLHQRWDGDLFRTQIEGNHVIGLILASPLERADELRARKLLTRAASFMQKVEKVFIAFARSVRLPLTEPRYPLVLLIFETDEDFETYTREATGGGGLSAGNIAGFYSSKTNWLAIRLSECQTFEVPLHEAIHQQVFNREVFKRYAPIPVWFNEGIATGFEGDGERINVGPTKVNSNFARQAGKARQLNWATVVADDRAFRGDVLAGEAYTHAWSLHWMLVTQYPERYTEYVAKLSEYEPLQEVSASERTNLFENTFGHGVSDIQAKFPGELQAAIRKQRVKFKEQDRVGVSFTQARLGEVEMYAVDRNGLLEANGSLRNVSPLRDMAFYVTIVTDGGSYTDWYLPRVKQAQVLPLPRQMVNKVVPGDRGGPGESFRVRIHSAVPGSEAARRWENNQFPRPEPLE